MAQMNGMEKRNFTHSTQNGGKTAEMRNNSTKSGMVGMSEYVVVNSAVFVDFHTDNKNCSNNY